MISRYASLRQGLVGAWCPSVQRCGSGFTLPDLSGYGNHGTLTNMDPGTDWVTSGGGLALDFDGSNDYVTSIGSVSAFAFVQNTMRFGFSWWIKLEATGTRYAIVGNTSASTENGFVLIFENGVGVGIRAIRLATFRGVLSSAVSDFRSSDGAINDTEWHHVAITAAGNGNSGMIFVDGRQLSTTVSINLNALATGNSTRAMTLGSQTNGFTLPFGGKLDDFRIYNRALTPTEIQQLYTGGRGVGLAPERIKHRRKTTAAAAFKAAWARRQQHIGSGVY